MKTYRFSIGVIAVAMWCTTGCNQSADPAANAPAATEDAHSDHDHGDHSHDDHAHEGESGHDHHEEGPHKGHLVELGNGKFHAELVHDEGSVTIYLLDESTKTAVAIEATEVLINLKHEGKAEQFKLSAVPDAGDPAGKSSRFSIQDAELAGHIDDEAADARINVLIEGTAYTGSLAHHH